ncbi:NUDIX hydrolase domain-like protein [Scheffersomyces xylosifermentans]|uniref:NUDIX hydrolase domain-like protein n=1 Tax=Scheffersomyces xylosifermentans TaxID=1304137 RepID=UPI00315D6598
MTQKSPSKRLRYTLGFVFCPETKQILLLNRNKSPWMGKWNGVGGKLDPEETPLECIIRETREETGLEISNYVSRGILTWNVTYTQDSHNQPEVGGLYIFTGEITKEELEEYKTPKVYCKEGILDWKTLEWALHSENLGIVDNLQIIFKHMFDAKDTDLFTVKYQDSIMLSCIYYPGKNIEYPVS